MAKFITLRPCTFDLEFRDPRTASVHGGQLAVTALLEQFGLAEWVAGEPALDPRTDQGKGFAPLVYVAQLRYCFTSGGVSLADAERLNEDEPFKTFVGVEKLPDQTALVEWLCNIGLDGWQALRRQGLVVSNRPFTIEGTNYLTQFAVTQPKSQRPGTLFVTTNEVLIWLDRNGRSELVPRN